jgi:hypothetical protein
VVIVARRDLDQRDVETAADAGRARNKYLTVLLPSLDDGGADLDKSQSRREGVRLLVWWG